MIIRNKAILTFGPAYRQASNSGRVIEIGLVLLLWTRGTAEEKAR